MNEYASITEKGRQRRKGTEVRRGISEHEREGGAEGNMEGRGNNKAG